MQSHMAQISVWKSHPVRANALIDKGPNATQVSASCATPQAMDILIFSSYE